MIWFGGKPGMRKTSLLFLIGAVALSAHGLTLGSHTSWGSQLLIEDIAADGDFGPDDRLNWNADYINTRSTDSSQTTTSNQPVVDITNDFRGGLGWSADPWAVNLDLETANTPQESLTTNSVLLGGQYKHRSVGNKDDGFRDYWSLKLTVGSSTYNQDYSTVVMVRNRKPRSVTGQNVVRQHSLKLEGKWRPWRPWLFKLSWAGYGYDKDPAAFEASLNSTRNVGRNLNGFSNTLGGLPSSTVAAGLLWYFIEDYDLNLNYSRSVLAADHSQSRITRVQVEGDITAHWNLALGLEYDQSDSSHDTLGLAGVEYTF